MLLLSSAPTLRPIPRPAIGPRLAPPPLARRNTPLAVRLSLESRDGGPALALRRSNAVLVAQSSPSPLPANSGLRRDPQLGLFSLLFVISMAIGSFFSLAIISLPALNAFKRLSVSADKLSKVVSEEVPGTLSSLKLSGLEINDLTFQLNVLKGYQENNMEGKSRKKQALGDEEVLLIGSSEMEFVNAKDMQREL